MKTTKRNIAVFTAALAVIAFTSVGTVSAKETKETKGPVVTKKTEVKTSSIPNKYFHNRRGYYDRYNDVWVYFVR